MANQEQLGVLRQGVKDWNRWRRANPRVKIDLNGAALYKASLPGINLSHAFLRNADLGCTDLRKADLRGADIGWANISEARLDGANLSQANLAGCNLSETHFEDADLTGCQVYAISAWNLSLNANTKQSNLVITKPDEPPLTTDNIRVAQFLYLILNNAEIRDVINTLTSKSVLILGRFADEKRKAVLDSIRTKLRTYNLLPIVFDFTRPTDRDFTEMVQTVAGLSLFVIIDVTNPKSTPLEMEAIVKHFKIPYVPIIDLRADRYPFSMIVDLQKNFHWVLPTYGYRSKQELLENLEDTIIKRAVDKHNELRKQKAREQTVLTLSDLKKKKHSRK